MAAVKTIEINSVLLFKAKDSVLSSSSYSLTENQTPFWKSISPIG